MQEKYWLTQVNKDELAKLKEGDKLGILQDVDEFLNPLLIRLYSMNGKSVGVIPDKYFDHVQYHITLPDSQFFNTESRYEVKIDVIDLDPSEEDDDPKDFPMCRIIIDWHIKEEAYIPFDNTTYIGAPKPNKYIQANSNEITETKTFEKHESKWPVIIFIIAAIILALIIL